MQLVIAAIGRMKRGPAAELVADYLKRTRWDITIKELPDAPGNVSAEARTAREGQAILALLDKESRLVALDARGDLLTSETFAQSIQTHQQRGVKKLVFAIGGQDGLGDAVLGAAHTRLAFGTMIWPHQLVRVLLAEQLYRAYTITVGHPYHLGH